MWGATHGKYSTSTLTWRTDTPCSRESPLRKLRVGETAAISTRISIHEILRVKLLLNGSYQRFLKNLFFWTFILLPPEGSSVIYLKVAFLKNDFIDTGVSYKHITWPPYHSSMYTKISQIEKKKLFALSISTNQWRHSYSAVTKVLLNLKN